jgi:hypothetical protein
MMRSSMVKVAVAFIAGLMVALASALVYVKSHEKTDSPPVAQIDQAPAPQAAASPEPAASPKELPTATSDLADHEDAKTPPPVAPKPVETRKTRRVKAVRHTEPPPPVQVVENKPIVPAPPTVHPASAPAYPATSQASQDQSAQVQSAPPVQPPPEPHVVELAAGTQLVIRLAETLSTDHNYSGDTFRGTLDQRIVRNGFIIAEKGSTVLGRIVQSDKAGRVRGMSQLNVTLTEINTTDRQRIEVQTNSVEKRGQASTGSDTAKIAGGAALGALIGALGGGKGAAIGAGAGGAAGTGVVLATRGKAAVLPNESILTFELSSPVSITEQLNH